MMKWCLMSSDVSWHIRDKLWQCRSMVQYSFTSTETKRLVRTDSPGRPPRLSHSSWTMPLGKAVTDVYIYPQHRLLVVVVWGVVLISPVHREGQPQSNLALAVSNKLLDSFHSVKPFRVRGYYFSLSRSPANTILISAFIMSPLWLATHTSRWTDTFFHFFFFLTAWLGCTLSMRVRDQELWESRGGRPGLPSLISQRFLWT